MVIQGRRVTSEDIAFIREIIRKNESWTRTRISCELCAAWNWRDGKGRLRDMACRGLLLKLERAEHINLPPPRRPANNHLRNRFLEPVTPPVGPIESTLKERMPIELVLDRELGKPRLFARLLSQHHYLGYTGAVGENRKYLALDRNGEVLACLLFGAAAWKVAPRDAFIGWDRRTRERRLSLITNNTRFLILPWVRVPHLASHLLGRVARRLSEDWEAAYGHPIHLLETFVEQGRFRGVAYRAANWVHVGETQGRSRNDRDRTFQVPTKDIFVYPLKKHFRKSLCDDA